MPTDIDKQQLHSAIIAALQALVDNARQAVDRAYEAATHEENIAENKYDTLGLEASYLTQGQARRLAECEADLMRYQALPVKAFAEDDTVAVGALLQVVDQQDRVQTFFLGPAAGGVKVRLHEHDIVIITASAPLGKALLGSHLGDEVTVQIGGTQSRYEIIAVC